jgi:two-component sensor histidine kinase
LISANRVHEPNQRELRAAHGRASKNWPRKTAAIRLVPAVVLFILDCMNPTVAAQPDTLEELRRSESTFLNFFNEAPIGLVWLSASGAILRANRAQLDLLGCTAEGCVGHYLTNTLQKELAAKSPAAARQLGRIAKVIYEAMAKVRSLSHGLHPVALESHGLMAALESLARRTKSLFQIRCRFICRQPVLIKDNAVATHLYRIAQEAITNAIKHAQPGRVEISLSETPERIHLAIRDDGVGLPARQRKKSGMGLHIMRYRARIIDGSLAIQKEAGGGTAVVCSVHRSGRGRRRPPPSTGNSN